MRKNPMVWDDAPAEGVLSPLDRDPLASDDMPSLLGLPDGQGMLGARQGATVDGEASADVHTVFETVKAALAQVVQHNRASRVDLDHLTDKDLELLKDALGAGEVSVLLHGGPDDENEAQILETALPGVWVGRADNADGSVQTHWLEVADAPFALRRLAVERPQKALDVAALDAPRGAMNVMGVLAEIAERSAAWQPGDESHVINFTLFPMSAADSAFLSKTLGEVGVQVMSGGYGVARVVMTAVPNVWAVQFLNGMGTTILDTIEIGDVPSCVLASKEDFEDSLSRLADIQSAYLQ